MLKGKNERSYLQCIMRTVVKMLLQANSSREMAWPIAMLLILLTISENRTVCFLFWFLGSQAFVFKCRVESVVLADRSYSSHSWSMLQKKAFLWNGGRWCRGTEQRGNQDLLFATEAHRGTSQHQNPERVKPSGMQCLHKSKPMDICWSLGNAFLLI